MNKSISILTDLNSGISLAPKYIQASQDSGFNDEPLSATASSSALFKRTVQEFLDQVCYRYNFNDLVPNWCPGTFS